MATWRRFALSECFLVICAFWLKIKKVYVLRIVAVRASTMLDIHWFLHDIVSYLNAGQQALASYRTVLSDDTS